MKTSPAAAGLAVVDLARQGRFAEIRERFAPQPRPMVPAEVLQAAWESEVAKSGPVRSVGTAVTEPARPGAVVVKIPVTFEHGALTVAVGMTGDEGSSSRTGGLHARLPVVSCRPGLSSLPGRLGFRRG